MVTMTKSLVPRLIGVGVLAFCLSMLASTMAAQPTGGSGELARPTPQQVAWQDFEIGTFIHFAPNTWLDMEYDDLSLPLAQMNPAELDTDQWAAAAEAMGAKYLVFVAKHVGGFCMWQTETTDYSVKSIPWRDGQGDVLGDLAQSCRKRGIKLGVYLSPADRKHGAGVGGRCRTEEDQQRYNAVYRQQLTEVLTRYGEMVEVWFDGSNVIEVGDILQEHAPRAVIFQGPHATIRWVGNEEGVAPYPAWNAVSAEVAAAGVATARHGDPRGTVWLPNECDARIRANWFWNSRNAPTLKTVDQLMEMYYHSVGRGAVLLLNHTPDTTGLIPAADVRRGAEFAAEVRRRLGRSAGQTEGSGNELLVTLDEPTWIDHVVIMEDIGHGERVREYRIEGLVDSTWQAIGGGTAVGHKRIERIVPVEVSGVRLHITQAVGVPHIRKLAVYATGDRFVPPPPPSQSPLAHWTCDAIREGRLTDRSAREQHGRVVDATIVAEGRLDGALQLNGRTSYVEVGNLPLLAGDFTIAAWVNPRSGGEGSRVIVSKETQSVGAHQCRWYLTGDHRVGFMMCGAHDGGIWPFESQATVPAGAWSHLAVARSGDQFTLYLNGKAVGQKTSPTPFRHHNNDSLKIGTVTNSAGTPWNLFDGLLDDVRIYNRPLAQDELAQLAAATEPTAATAAWRWSPNSVGAEWSHVKIDVTRFCPEAAQYRVAFEKTDGRHELEVRSLVAVFDGRRIAEYVERDGQSNAFFLTVPGVGVPLQLEAVVRTKGGSDSSGRVTVTRRR